MLSPHFRTSRFCFAGCSHMSCAQNCFVFLFREFKANAGAYLRLQTWTRLVRGRRACWSINNLDQVGRWQQGQKRLSREEIVACRTLAVVNGEPLRYGTMDMNSQPSDARSFWRWSCSGGTDMHHKVSPCLDWRAHTDLWQCVTLSQSLVKIHQRSD